MGHEWLKSAPGGRGRLLRARTSRRIPRKGRPSGDPRAGRRVQAQRESAGPGKARHGTSPYAGRRGRGRRGLATAFLPAVWGRGRRPGALLQPAPPVPVLPSVAPRTPQNRIGHFALPLGRLCNRCRRLLRPQDGCRTPRLVIRDVSPTRAGGGPRTGSVLFSPSLVYNVARRLPVPTGSPRRRPAPPGVYRCRTASPCANRILPPELLLLLLPPSRIKPSRRLFGPVAPFPPRGWDDPWALPSRTAPSLPPREALG
jgi:hypothetical protein